MRSRLSVPVVTIVLGMTSGLSAQEASLADLAAREAERRGAVTQPSRVFTDADVIPAVQSPAQVQAPVAAPAISPPPMKSIYERRRERGEVELERAIQMLAQEADDLDTEQRRYSIACTGRRSVGVMLAHNRFVSVTVNNERLPECLLLRSDIASLSTRIRTGLEQALESARRADVYPGTVRDLRRKYALDGAGWDR